MKQKFQFVRSMQAASLLVVGALALSACGAKAEAEPVDAEPAAVKEEGEPVKAGKALGSAVAIVNGETYNFDLDTCKLTGDDIIVSGLGSGGPSGEGAWFEAEMKNVDGEWDGGMRVVLGTEQADKDTGDAYYIFMLQQEDYGFSSFAMDDGGEVVFSGTAKLEDGNTSAPAQVSFVCGDFPLQDPTDYFDMEIEPAAAESDFGSTAECMLGSWTADNDYFLIRIQELGEEVKSVTGIVTVVFEEDGTMRTIYKDWNIEAVTSDMEVQIERDGRDLAEYIVSGDSVDIRDVEIDSRMQLITPAVTLPVVLDPIENLNAAVKCGADSMSIEVDDGVMQLTRDI